LLQGSDHYIRIFTCSLSDFFHADISKAVRDRAWRTIKNTPNCVYLILTKRPENIKNMLPADWGAGYPNVWLGTSVGCKQTLSKLDSLRKVPCALRFVSCEPLLEDIASQINLDGIGWVIVGGESGPGARPMHPHWVRDIRDQCQRAGVPFFFKQWGEWRAMERWGEGDQTGHLGPPTVTLLDGCLLRRVGKHAAGRELDGRTWDEYPVRAA